MSDERSLTQRISEMEESQREIREQLQNAKGKKWKMPLRGKIGRKKLKMGYATVIYMDENKNLDIRREPIIDNTIKDSRKTKEFAVHAVTEEDIFYSKGKPIIFQPDKTINPYNPLKQKNEVYGQKYVMARMLNEALKPKKGIGGFGWWIIILLIVGGVAYYFMKSKGIA